MARMYDTVDEAIARSVSHNEIAAVTTQDAQAALARAKELAIGEGLEFDSASLAEPMEAWACKPDSNHTMVWRLEIHCSDAGMVPIEDELDLDTDATAWPSTK